MTTTAWKKVEETVETGPDTGDILAPLKHVRQQYAIRADDLEAAGKSEYAEYYNEQAANIDKLIRGVNL